MATVNSVYEFLDRIAPVEHKAEKDNVGLLVGRRERELSKILVSLDITDDAISEAADEGAGLIVSHHPVLFSLSSITDSDVTGRRLLKLIENGIAAICMHTNLDTAQGGVNDVLAALAGIQDPLPLSDNGKTPEGGFSCGRFGCLQNPVPMSEYLPKLVTALDTPAVRYHDSGRGVFRVAVAGGAGGSDFSCVLKQECDTFITADIKYDMFLEAKELGINLIDGGHFCTENVIIPPLADKLREAFPDVAVTVSKRHGRTTEFYINPS